jgi:putative ABC transport system permease protein
LSYGLKLSVAGIAIGVFAALDLTQALKTMLVDVKPTDPATFLAIVVLFVVMAALASWMPALRAAALDPVEALREE